MRPDPPPSPDDLYGTHWGQHFQAAPTEPRPLTDKERERLARLGFHELALDLAAGTCDKQTDEGVCGLNKRSRVHRALCEPPPKPLRAVPPPAQPWDVRPARKRAA